MQTKTPKTAPKLAKLRSWQKPQEAFLGVFSCTYWQYASAGAVFLGAHSSLTAYETELMGAEFLILGLGRFFGRRLHNLANSDFFAERLRHSSFRNFPPFIDPRFEKLNDL